MAAMDIAGDEGDLESLKYVILTLCKLGNFPCFLLSADFFSKFSKNISGLIPSEFQTVWIQVRPDMLSGLSWVQTVCTGYQQTTLADEEFILF